MIFYRFANSKFSNDISGEGARRYGGRWNNKGNPVVYASFTISLSLVELLIHSVSYDEIKSNELMVIETSVNHFTDVKQLKKDWQHDEDYSKYIGDEFLRSSSHLLLRVPSVIIPEEYNILINPLHKDFNKVKIKSIYPFHFDVRLFKAGI